MIYVATNTVTSKQFRKYPFVGDSVLPRRREFLFVDERDLERVHGVGGRSITDSTSCGAIDSIEPRKAHWSGYTLRSSSTKIP